MNELRDPAPARHVRRGIAVVVLSALLVPPGTLLLLRMVPALDLVLRSAVGHLVVVSAISACALAVAVAAAAAAGRRTATGAWCCSPSAAWGSGSSCSPTGSSPRGSGGGQVNPWVGRLPVLAIAAFAGCLAAAAWPQRGPATWAGRWPAGTLAAAGLSLTLALVAVSLWPAGGPGGRLLPGEAGLRLALVLGAALVLVAVGAVHWRRWRLGLDRMQLALVVACLLSAGALLSLEMSRPWHLAWWDYHAEQRPVGWTALTSI